jgi:hypothetical protein
MHDHGTPNDEFGSSSAPNSQPVSPRPRISFQRVRLAGGGWLVLVCSERKVPLADCWWLVCSERKVLLAGLF